ncbi:MAG: hypothetical protein ABI402_05350 [Ferruginibacter sp.]
MKKLNILLLTTITGCMLTSFTYYEDWYVFEDNSCKINFPAKAENDSSVIDSQIGKLTVFTHMYSAPGSKSDSNLVYGLIETEYPEDYIKLNTKELEEHFFKGAVTGVLNKVNGKLISEKEINIGKYPGREILVDYPERAVIIKMRFFIERNKLFALQTISNAGKEKNTNSSRFMNSFELK